MKHLTSQTQFDIFDDVHTLILVMIAAVLLLTILLLRTPTTAVLTTEQISLMPSWGA